MLTCGRGTISCHQELKDRKDFHIVSVSYLDILHNSSIFRKKERKLDLKNMYILRKIKHQVTKKLKKKVFLYYQHREGQYAAAMKTKRQNNQPFFLNPKQVYQPLS